MQVRCSHILQKHTGSRNPVDSFRNKKITRSLEEARQNIKKFREEINGNLAVFGEYAAKYSECRSASKNGDLGYFGKG